MDKLFDFIKLFSMDTMTILALNIDYYGEKLAKSLVYHFKLPYYVIIWRQFNSQN